MVIQTARTMLARRENFKFSVTKGRKKIFGESPPGGTARGKKCGKLDKMFHDMIRLKCPPPPPRCCS
jgi:hypothetical protein